MSCPSCSCATAGTTCDSCGSYVSVENGIVQPVKTGVSLRVSDRNGLPRDLITIPSAIPSSDRGGNLKNRDGSTGNEINLALLRQVLAATGGIAVLDANGDLAVLPKPTFDAFVASKSGVVTWTDVLPRSNLLREAELAPNRNRLLTIGCSSDGLVDIGFLDQDETDYIGIDSEGKPIGRTFCDSGAVDTLDAIFGCSGGVLSKLTGITGKSLLINGDGKFYLDDAVDEETWVGGPAIWSKPLTEPQDIEFPEVNIAFGGSVPNTALWVQVCVIMYCGTSTSHGTARIYVNDVPVIINAVSGDFGSFDGSVVMYVPYGAGTFKVRGSFFAYNAGSTGGEGEVTASIVSYK